MAKSNQCRNLIGSSKVICLRFLNASLGTWFKNRDVNLKTKTGRAETKKITYINSLLTHHNRLSSDSPTTVQRSQLGSVLFDFTPPRAFDFNKKLTQNFAIT